MDSDTLILQVDQMVIHSASDLRPRTTLCGDYFYNYFTRGLDILFDGQVCTLPHSFIYIHSHTIDNGCSLLCAFCILRLTKSRSLCCTLTTLVMLILIHTLSATLLSIAQMVSNLLFALQYLDWSQCNSYVIFCCKKR